MFSWLKSNFKIVISVLITVVLLSLATYAYVTYSKLYESYINVSNQLATTDSLKVVYRNENQVLSARYAFLEKDFDKAVGNNKLLNRYIKEKDAEVLALINKVEETRLENLRLTGLLKKDSTGAEYGLFDTSTTYYTLRARAYVKPSPLLFIDALSLMDSSTIAINKIENGFITGIVTHTNPHVSDKNADFHIKAPAMPMVEVPKFTIITAIALAIGIGIGLLL